MELFQRLFQTIIRQTAAGIASLFQRLNLGLNRLSIKMPGSAAHGSWAEASFSFGWHSLKNSIYDLSPVTKNGFITSGTASKPKLVPLLQRNPCASARHIGPGLALMPEDRCLNIMPGYLGNPQADPLLNGIHR
jgi:hypothetical protein